MDRIPAIRRAILADVPPLQALGWSVVAVAAPTLLRWAIDVGEGASPFVTYYPALALAALFLGWRWGVVVAVVSIAVANRLFGVNSFVDEVFGPNGPIMAVFVLSCAVLVLTGEMVRRLVREIEGAKAREEVLNIELMHRVKNMFATVNALATLTARHSSPEEFSTVLSGRMRALLRATELLGIGEKAHCNVDKLVDNALAPFKTAGNFTAEGPTCELPRDACVPLSLALHELATNAHKYGALSTPEGRVDLRWTLGEGEMGLMRLAWREIGGPPVAPPARTGMGTQLLRRQRGLKAVKLNYRRDGVRCEINVEGVAAEPAAEA